MAFLSKLPNVLWSFELLFISLFSTNPNVLNTPRPPTSPIPFRAIYSSGLIGIHSSTRYTGLNFVTVLPQRVFLIHFWDSLPFGFFFKLLKAMHFTSRSSRVRGIGILWKSTSLHLLCNSLFQGRVFPSLKLFLWISPLFDFLPWESSHSISGPFTAVSLSLSKSLLSSCSLISLLR